MEFEDLRFYIASELHALDEYLRLLENKLDDLLNVSTTEQVHALALFATPGSMKLSSGEDKAQGPADEALFQVAAAMQIALPQKLWGAFIMSLWLVFEDGVVGLADYWAEKELMIVRIRDLKGNIMQRAHLFFSPQISFPSSDAQKSSLGLILRIRNCIVHGNCRLRENDIGYFAQNLHPIAGLAFEQEMLGEYEFLKVDKDLCRWAYRVIYAELAELTKGVGENAGYPPAL